MSAVAELAVSNICWPDGLAAQEEAINTLGANGIRAIDIAPGKAFPEMATVGPDGVDRDELVAFRRTLRTGDRKGLMRVAGLQAVTFGRTESIFSEDKVGVDALAGHMRGIIRLAEFVGAQTIVYGSGGTRLTEGLSDEQVSQRAAEFFGPLNQDAYDSGVVLGIEPVSTTWAKGRPVFGRTAQEVVDFTSQQMRGNGFHNIQFVPDSFAIHDGLEAGDSGVLGPIREARENGVLAPHAQIAEPGMVPHSAHSDISTTHHDLDTALSVEWQDMARTRTANGEPLPTIAIEMFAPKLAEDGTMRLVSDVLSLALTGARVNYFRSIGYDSYWNH